MSKIQHILISGGAGFIGSHLANLLLESNYKVSVLDNLSPQIHGENPEQDSPQYLSIKDKVNFIKGDVCSRTDWLKALEGVDAVVHLAAETGTGQSMYAIEKYNLVNSQGTAILCDILVNEKHQVKKQVLGSTRAVYGEGSYVNKEGNLVYPKSRKASDMKAGKFDLFDENGGKLKAIPTAEDARLLPSSIYAISKLYQEQLIQTTCESLELNYTILRFQNVYGAGQSMKNPYTGILSIFSTQMLENKAINLFEDAKPARDFIEVRDVVEAIKRSVEKPAANGEIINIGSGQPTEVMAVVQALEKAYNLKADWKITGDFRLGDIRYNVADISKMKEILDFEAKVSFEEGIKRLADWAKQQEIKENAYEQSLEEMKRKGLFLSS